MKKIFVSIVILVFLVGVLFWRGDETQLFLESQADHTIELRDNGYDPKDITVQKGEVVKFTTTRDKHFWPASNLHPSHRAYPEFDPKEPIKATDNWTFRFDRVGEWRYHDHLSPYFAGKIKVVE